MGSTPGTSTALVRTAAPSTRSVTFARTASAPLLLSDANTRTRSGRSASRRADTAVTPTLAVSVRPTRSKNSSAPGSARSATSSTDSRPSLNTCTLIPPSSAAASGASNANAGPSRLR